MSTPRDLWLLRILALAVAIGAWAAVTLDDRQTRMVEKVVDASVTYPPLQGFIILNPLDTVRVRLRGPEASLNEANPYSVDVRVELLKPTAGSVDIPLVTENVRLPKGFEVVSLEPQILHLEIDREIRSLVPVRVRLAGEPAAGAVALSPSPSPKEILVRGPASLVGRLTALDTAEIRLEGHALSFEESVLVLSPDPSLVRFEQSPVVTVSVPMRQPELPSVEERR